MGTCRIGFRTQSEHQFSQEGNWTKTKSQSNLVQHTQKNTKKPKIEPKYNLLTNDRHCKNQDESRDFIKVMYTPLIYVFFWQ